MPPIVRPVRPKKANWINCETCETKEGKLDQIEREIELSGPLDDSQKKRLLQIANRCPVHRTLHSEIIVKSKLKA
jgi:putative redox protein